MKRNLKVLGLAVVAVLAMSVVAASAQGAKFEAGAYTSEIVGEQEGTHEFAVETSMTKTKVECPVAKFTGTLTEAKEIVKVHPTYEGTGETPCKAFGLNATITTTGCDYEVQAKTTTEALIDIICTAGNAIKVVASTCEVQVAGNTVNQDLAGVLENKAGPPETVNLNVNIAGITYQIIKDGIGCPLRQTGLSETPLSTNQTDGTYVGNTVVKAFKGGVQQHATVK